MRAETVASFPVRDGGVIDGTRTHYEVATEDLFQRTCRGGNRSQEDHIAPVSGQPEARSAAHVDVLRIARRIVRIPLRRDSHRRATESDQCQQESAKTIVAPHVDSLKNGQAAARGSKTRAAVQARRDNAGGSNTGAVPHRVSQRLL